MRDYAQLLDTRLLPLEYLAQTQKPDAAINVCRIPKRRAHRVTATHPFPHYLAHRRSARRHASSKFGVRCLSETLKDINELPHLVLVSIMTLSNK